MPITATDATGAITIVVGKGSEIDENPLIVDTT
jgi:hypothetical protein